MANKGIKLGDQIEDVTAKVQGIAIGHVTYLDGSQAWLLQPPYGDDGGRIPVVEVQDAYAIHIADGVFEPPKPTHIGFHARNGSGK